MGGRLVAVWTMALQEDGMTNAAVERTQGYVARVEWTGNLGEGTAGYARYGREFRVHIDGKAVLEGTADTAYRGVADLHNPEELFLAAVAACHMLFYLSSCARRGVRVLSYEDSAAGTLELESEGGGRFRELLLSPVVTIDGTSDVALAVSLHDTAHALCFLARSCSVPVRHRPRILVRRSET